jgi:hypothetical protein
VDKFFKTLAKLVWRVVQYFHSPEQKTTGQKHRKRVSERGKKLARLASGFVFLLSNPEFHSHLASGYPHPWLQSLFRSTFFSGKWAIVVSLVML